MAKKESLNTKVPYQNRLIKRNKLASKVSRGYYNSTSTGNKGKKYPMPMAVLTGVEKIVGVEVDE